MGAAASYVTQEGINKQGSTFSSKQSACKVSGSSQNTQNMTAAELKVTSSYNKKCLHNYLWLLWKKFI